MGTTPTNGASRLELKVANSNVTAKITFWPLHGNRTYQLQSRSELGLPVWQNVSTNPVAVPQGMGVFAINTTNAPQSFYRLRVLMDTNSESGSLVSVPSRATLFTEEFCGPFRIYVR